jgi:hypothetical protein
MAICIRERGDGPAATAIANYVPPDPSFDSDGSYVARPAVDYFDGASCEAGFS